MLIYTNPKFATIILFQKSQNSENLGILTQKSLLNKTHKTYNPNGYQWGPYFIVKIYFSEFKV